MAKTRIVFLGTPEFACPTLEVLLAEPEHYEIVAVGTQPDRPAGRNLEVQSSKVKIIAQNFVSKATKGKKLNILTPEKINNPEVIKQIAALTPDVAIVVA